MRSTLLLLILAIAVSFALLEIIIRNFSGEARMPEPQPVVTAPPEKTLIIAQPTTTFRGPVGDPKIIGPSAPPPDY